MLKAEDNEILTRVGPGTLMGELLRRYWTPACLTAEIPEPGSPPARVRLLGENLVAFRDTRGRVGLVQENCPHRGASLYFGRNEGASLRCVYHGWAFDVDGTCVDMPSEPAPFCEKVRMKSYPVHESGGIVWTYMGPRETMTPFRDFGTEGLAAVRPWRRSSTRPATGCRRWKATSTPPTSPTCTSGTASTTSPTTAPTSPATRPTRCRGSSGGTTAPPRLEVDDTWFGYRYAGIRTTPNGNTHVRVTAYALPYATMVASIPFSVGCGMFVPIDDENCWRYFCAPKAWRNPRNYGGANLFSLAPFSTPVTQSPQRDHPSPVHGGKRLPAVAGGPGEAGHLQRRRRLREPGPDGDRVDGPDLRPHAGAARLHRQGDHPDAAHPPLGGEGARRGQGAPGPGRRTSPSSGAPRRSSNRVRTGGRSARRTTPWCASPRPRPPASS